VLAVILGVVNALVVAKAVPNEAALNQAMVAPVGGVADKATVPVPHLDPAVTAGAAGAVVTVAVTATLVAETHPVVKFLVSA
jgi:hypothetical protein